MAAESCGILKPSPRQLRALWDFDNKCAHNYMGVPLRQCSSIEPPDVPGEICLPEAMMALVKKQITDMWIKMSTILEVFKEDDKPELGYRLRVKPDVPIRISMKAKDGLLIGWKASIPNETCPSAHLYYRSDMMEHSQYLGGPVSYCNYGSPKEATLLIRQVSHGSSKHLVRVENNTKVKAFLSPGTELLWDYGKKVMPEFSNDTWFQPKCCSISVSTEKMKSNDRKTAMEVYKELCVLCGEPYKAKRRDWTGRKCQKKVHFMSSHVNFLGTEWDGCSEYDPYDHVVDYRRALIESERLVLFLKRLESDSWKVVPACVVMSKQERETLDPVTLMKIFASRCRLLKKLGSIVVRGNSTASIADHLSPVVPSPWNVVFPKGRPKPKRVYALPEEDRQTLSSEIKDDALQDVYMVLNIQQIEEAGNSSSEEYL